MRWSLPSPIITTPAITLRLHCPHIQLSTLTCNVFQISLSIDECHKERGQLQFHAYQAAHLDWLDNVTNVLNVHVHPYCTAFVYEKAQASPASVLGEKQIIMIRRGEFPFLFVFSQFSR